MCITNNNVMCNLDQSYLGQQNGTGGSSGSHVGGAHFGTSAGGAAGAGGHGLQTGGHGLQSANQNQWFTNLRRQILLAEEMELLAADEGLRALKDAAIKAEGEYQMWLALKRKAD